MAEVPAGISDASGAHHLSPEISTVAFIDSPIRNGCFASSAGSRSMRTGRRWTILIQLPDAFCAGISEKAEPVLVTLGPVKATPAKPGEPADPAKKPAKKAAPPPAAAQ